MSSPYLAVLATVECRSASWIAWASAAGTRTLLRGERNFALDYFSKA